MNAAALFGQLADIHHLTHTHRVSGDGLPEQYLYSPDMIYRYGFGRWWGGDDVGATAVWVMLNPATGDTESRPRPTLGRAMGWTRQLGATGIIVVNLFALRATKPVALRAAPDPVGPANDAVLAALTGKALLTVAAWGTSGALGERGAKVARMLPEARCLGHTAKGHPRHPLYVPASAGLVPLGRIDG